MKNQETRASSESIGSNNTISMRYQYGRKYGPRIIIIILSVWGKPEDSVPEGGGIFAWETAAPSARALVQSVTGFRANPVWNQLLASTVKAWLAIQVQYTLYRL